MAIFFHAREALGKGFSCLHPGEERRYNSVVMGKYHGFWWVFLLIFFVFPLSQVEAGFGISPPYFSAEHLVPGVTYGQSIYLVRDDPSMDLPMRAELELNPPSVKEWLTVDPGIEFVIPKGVRQFPVTIKAKVPKDIKLASYGGNIRFVTVPPKNGQVTIAYGANLQLNLVVGEGIFKKFSVPLVKILDIEEGWDPRVLIRYNNEGNVTESLTGATFEVRDQFDSVRLGFVQTKDNFPEIPAFVSQEQTVDFPIDTHLSLGQYYGLINLYQGDKLVASQKMVFNVLPPGTFSGLWGKILGYLKIRQFGPYYLIGILILGYIFIFSKRRKDRR